MDIPTYQEVLDGLEYSYWLKDAVKSIKDIDILDALADAKMLVALIEKHYNDIHGL